MANFDVAVGITQKGLNNTLSDFFNDPNAKKNIFQQKITKVVQGMNVVVNIGILKAPTIIMAPPSVADWLNSYGTDGVKKTGSAPTKNVFQVNIPSLKIDGTLASAKVSGEGSIAVYGEFSLTGHTLTVDGISVWIDESKWKKDGLTKAIVNAIVIPHALDTINKMLNAIPFPEIPKEYAKSTFQDPTMEIVANQELVVATSMKSSQPTDLSAYVSPPQEDIYLQVGLNLINNEVSLRLPKGVLEAKDSSGGKAAKATAEIKATLKSIKGKISGGKTMASLDIINISGYGELSGIGVAIAKTALCPIGTAIDAISDPKNWDKVISSFDITYKPDPLDVPFSVNISKTGSLDFSIGKIASVQIIAAPKWSGVIGSTLAAAAAGFVDLLSAIFKGTIVNSIIKDHAQNIQIAKSTSKEKTIGPITITLSGEVGAALKPMGTSHIVEGFTIAFN